MSRIRLAACAVLLPVALAGCHSEKETTLLPAETPPAPDTAQTPSKEPAPASPAQSTTDAIASAREQLKAGSVDEAAARLAKLQLQGASFNAQQAKDYRQALSEAYDRAIEASQRGDPKGDAALELLRAAAPR
jgi:hypothetical protein